MHLDLIMFLVFLLLGTTALGLLLWCFTLEETRCLQTFPIVKPNFNPTRELVIRQNQLKRGKE